MIYSYEWLKEFVPGIPKPKKLMDELSLKSVEVEEVIEGGVELGNVVVGELLEVRKHSNADTLNIGIFDVGEEQPRQIIFGGVANLEVGNKLPVALAPTTIPGGLKIKERKLRGELSQGMCCLNSELGILDREEAVHFFADEVQNGTPIVGVLPLSETVVDIDNKSMTHRADLFCHLGIARELSAVFETPLSEPKVPALPKAKPTVQITVQDPTDCPRYIAIELEVKVGPSPEEITRRLQSCGVKSINNVVDITNYVMLELGEPTHAFDADRLAGNAITVRRAKRGEKLRTLDHETKELTPDVLVIADSERAIAVAGVIGGEETAVNEGTTRIILEVANFEPLVVRRAAQAVGVRTEGALRWEKGLSPELASPAAARAIQLLKQHAGAKVLGLSEKYPSPSAAVSIELTEAFLHRLSGIQFSKAEVNKHLSALGCQVSTKKSKKGAVYTVKAPWWRTDLYIREDIVEELARLHGVNAIPEQQLSGVFHVPEIDPEIYVSNLVRHDLARRSLSESYNYSFYGGGVIEKMGWKEDKEHIEIQNPLSEDLRFLRVSLLPRLLENIQLNQAHRSHLRLFEIGHVYFADREVRQLGIVVMDDKEPYRVVRGLVEGMLDSLNVDYTTSVIEQTVPCEFWGMYRGGQALRLDLGKDILGTIGEVDQEVLNKFGIDHAVGFATLSVYQLSQHAGTTHQLTPISPYPAIPLDLSLIVDETVTWEQVEKVVKRHGKDLLQNIEVFDLYRGKGVPEGQKSLAFRVTMQSNSKTLEMETLEKWRDRLVADLGKKLGATLRDK